MPIIKPDVDLMLQKYGIDSKDPEMCWDCRGTIVLYHRGFERIAETENIWFEPPVFIEKDVERAVSVLVVGHLPPAKELLDDLAPLTDKVAWSIGEAAPGNYKNMTKSGGSYPWAMAEKRAKDRVVAKLVGISGFIYSEIEADEFKQASEPETPKPNIFNEAKVVKLNNGNGHANDETDTDKQRAWQKKVEKMISEAETEPDLDEIIARIKAPMTRCDILVKKAIERRIAAARLQFMGDS